MIKGCKHYHKLYYIKNRYWNLYLKLKRKYHNKKYRERKRKQSDFNSKENKKLKGKSNKPIKKNKIKPIVGLSYSISDNIEAIHFIVTDIDINLTVTFFLNSSCSHHFGCQREDFTELQNYTSRPLRGFTGV